MTNTWQQDLEWYRNHQTASQIGFNPDGMCLKVCRTSRGIGARFLTAKQAQDATPKEHRFTRVRDLRRGMKLFFDDPHDSNTAGHIVTMIGRVKGFDIDSMDDVLVETNSVVSGQLVIVRGSYFKQHWGDSFQFGTDFLNGVEFDYATKAKPKPPAHRDESARVQNFRESAPDWDVKILDRAIKAGRDDLKKDVAKIEAAVKALPHDEGPDNKDTRVEKFVARFEKERVLEMKLLNDAVKDGRTGNVKTQRDRIRQALKSALWV